MNSPYQSAFLGQYSEVGSTQEIETKLENLTVLPMEQTVEYTTDSYDLKTLDKAGHLHLHNVTGASHACWFEDTDNCTFVSAYRQYVYPLLH